jgi:DNA-binding transcriptional regulator GbsR (MarR family)
MGSIWGTNRSVGQIHALLYLSDKPLTAEDIADTLGLARSNVSNSLKELTGWSLIRREHVMGDRRDYFAAETDLWEMVRRIAEGRKAREIDPTLEMLRICLSEANDDRFISATVRDRVSAMHDFVAMLDTWAADMRRVPRAKLAMLMRLGAAVVRYLPGRMPVGPGAGVGDAPGLSGKGYENEPIENVEDPSKPP